MADYGPVKIRTGNINELIKIYQDSYSNLIESIGDATDAGKIHKAQLLARINRELESLGVDMDDWVKKNMPQYYLDGANAALQDLRKLGIDVTKVSAVINAEAIAYFTDEVSLAFSEGIRGLARNARRFIDDALKQQLNFIIADGQLTGAARQTVAAAVRQRLQVEGIASLVDKSGRKWKLGNYSDMLVRTKAVESRNYGLTNVMLNNGYDLVQVSDHGSDHLACRNWEGKILSLTGRTPGYPTVAEATNAGLFHPRCEHAINVINRTLALKTEAYSNPFGK